MARVLRGLGIAAVATGLAVNRYTLAPFSSGGEIESLLFNAAILLFQASAVAVGIYLWRRPTAATVANLALLAASLGMMTLFGEVAARVVVFGPAGLSYSAMKSTVDFGPAGLIEAAEEPGLVFALKPNHETRFALQPWRTNAHGMRDHPVDREKPPGTVRVAVIGDSFTAPSGVALEAAYHKRLEALAAAHYPETHFQFLNFGVPGYQLPQYAAMLEHRALDFAPDLILIGFCAENDHLGMPPSYEADPFEVPPRRNGFWRPVFAELLLHLNHLALADFDKSLQPEDEAFVDRYFARIAALAGDIPVVVAYLAILPRPGDGVARLAEARGFRFVDVSQAFAGAPLRPNSIYYPIDAHPNARANSRFAEVLFEDLQESGLLESLAAGQTGTPGPSGARGTEEPTNESP